MKEVVVTGMGMVSPIGQSPSEVLDSLLAVRSGISLWSAEGFTKTFPAGIVHGDFDTGFDKKDMPYLDRLTKLGIFAADRAIADIERAKRRILFLCNCGRLRDFCASSICIQRHQCATSENLGVRKSFTGTPHAVKR